MQRALCPWEQYPSFICCYENHAVAIETILTDILLLSFMEIVCSHAKRTVAMATTPIICLLLWKMYCCHGNYIHIHTVAMVHKNSVLLRKVLLPWELHPCIVCCYEKYTVAMETILHYTLLTSLMNIVFCYAKRTVTMVTTPKVCLLLWKMDCCHGNHSALQTVAMINEYSVLLYKEHCCHGNYTQTLLVAMENVLLPWK